MIGDGEPVQPFLPRGRDVLLGTGNSIAGKERVSVEVDVEGHVLDANLERAKMKSIGFKEWAIVCEALGRGRQSVILRKGGIAEGRMVSLFAIANFFFSRRFFTSRSEGSGEWHGNTGA